MVLTNDREPAQALKQKGLDAGRHTKSHTYHDKLSNSKPFPLESNQPLGQRGAPSLDRLNRRKTAHSLPCRAV
jgi:hypothetical protein